MNDPQAINQLEDATFRGLLEAAPDGILLVNRNGVIVFANAPCATMFGYAITELVGQYIEMIVPEYIRCKHASLRNRYFESPHSRPMGIGLDLVAARKDGNAIPVEISLSPFKFEGEDGAIAVVRDVTDQRRLQRELKRSNEELEQFAYVASHDLQEPLRMVAGYTQLLKRRHADKLNAEANEYVDFAVDGVKRMQELITDLLAFSRLNTRGKEFKPIDMNDVMQQAIANVQAAITESGAVVTAGKLPKVMGDRTQLIQLVQNLLSNAIKFHSAGVKPTIDVKAVSAGNLWQFSVVDNGIGIEPEYRDKVFVIFQRLHARDKYPGTGIGLSICKKIVERHHGRIWIDPAPPPGTSFAFTLPGAEGSK